MKKFGIISLLASLIFLSGCALGLEERKDNTEYGSLSCGDISRSIDVEAIKSAKVTVTGPGIKYEISTICNQIESGIGYFYIEKIPVGRNRIITVQAYDSTETIIEGAIIRTVIDIKVGSNELEMINNQTSCKGNVYNALFEAGIDISNISEEDEINLDSVIPTYDDCGEDLTRLDVEGIVADFTNEEVDLASKTKENYILPEDVYLRRLHLRHNSESTEKKPIFDLIAVYSDGTEVDVTKEAEWCTTEEGKDLVSIEDGAISFVGNKTGSVEIYGKYVDPNDTEGKYIRQSPKAMLDVKFQDEKSNYIYFYNDLKKLFPDSDADLSRVNYAMEAAKVAAWIWGDEIGSQWYPLETISIYRQENPEGQPEGTVWNHPIWQRVEIPEGAEGLLFARGKSIVNTEEWSGMIIPIYENGKDTGKTEGRPWNQTNSYTFAKDIGTKNIYRPKVWGGGSSGGNTTGDWSSEDITKIINDELKSDENIHLVNESLEFEVEAAHYYASIEMEPSEDDTTLSSVKVNGMPLNINHKMVYTFPPVIDENGDKNVSVEAVPNSKDATVEISSYGEILENGTSVEFEIIVIAKDGNKESYIVKVKREPYFEVTPDDPIEELDNGGIYIDDPEEETVTIVYDYKKWGETWNSEKLKAGTETHKIVLRGSFTKIYYAPQKRWKEDSTSYTLIYDENYDRYSLTLPYSALRVGFTGQPDFAFYVDGEVKDVNSVTFIDSKYIFNPNGNKIMILFQNDTEERLARIADNKEKFSNVKKLAAFDISNKQDRANITNLRLVPGTTKLYRSYHPYYAGHDGVPTERVRIEEIQKLIEELGIKSDINLCEDKTPTVGNPYTIYDDNGKGTTYETIVPDYYQNILNNKNVLYVGDSRFGGNGIIPSAEHVYYYSDSDFMIQWIKQILDFINDESNQAPFLMHCEIGVDRTGVFSAIFAGLCGSTWEQIANDYETSNNLCINEFRDANILKYSFERMLQVDDITMESDIKSLLYQYFTSKGISKSDLDSVVAKITAD